MPCGISWQRGDGGGGGKEDGRGGSSELFQRDEVKNKRISNVISIIGKNNTGHEKVETLHGNFDEMYII